MATRKFSELRAAIAADPIRAERLRHATEAVDQSYETYQVNQAAAPSAASYPSADCQGLEHLSARDLSDRARKIT